MVSFDLSAIDIVLTIAVIILFTLYLTRASTEATAKTNPYFSKKNSRTREEHKQGSKTETWNCPNSFGYLANLPKDTQIPNVCYSCPRMLECSSENE